MQNTYDVQAEKQGARRRVPDPLAPSKAMASATVALQRAQCTPRELSPADVLAVQRVAGNRAASRLLQPPNAPKAVQRVAMSSVSSAPDDLGARIRSAAGRGSPLPSAVRETIEPGLHADLSGVRVHTDGEADHLSQAVQAVAFTSGADIFFRQGTYNPSSPQGLHLLAHEAAHTVQQARGPVAGTPHPGGVSISDPGDSFERAADASAAQVSGAATAPAAQRTVTPGAPAGATPLQRQARTTTVSTTVPLSIQRLWNRKNPSWSSTQSIGTISSGQPILFFKDNLGDTMVVKAEDTPIGMTQVAAALHRSVNQQTVVETADVSAHKNAVVNMLDDTALTADESWQKLYDAWQAKLDKDYPDVRSPKQKARELHKRTFSKTRSIHAMQLAQGKRADALINPTTKPQGYMGMRQLLMDATHLRQLGMVTAADLFTANADRFARNLGNWFTAANGAITLIDNIDKTAKGMWKGKGVDINNNDVGGVLGETALLGRLQQNQLKKWANYYVAEMAKQMTYEGDPEAVDWMKEPHEGGNGTRQQFMEAHFLTGLTQGRDRIIALYAPKNRFLGGTGLKGQDKQTRKFMKQGSKDRTKVDQASGRVDPATGIDETVDYWDRIKARARWLKEH